MKDKSPFGLNEWLHFLKEKKFPVQAVNLSRLKTQLKRTEDTLDGMQANIASEPLLAFAILNEANRTLSNKNSEIKTPFHAAALVGTNRITKLFSRFEAYEITKRSPPNLIAFLSEVQTSYEAASMARFWTIQKISGHEDDIFWTTLFRDAARWLLWFYAYPVMEAITQKIRQGEQASKVEKSILGCRIDEITVHLCTYWKTPSKIIESFLSKHIPNKKEMQTLAHLAHHPDELPGFIEDKKLTILANNPLIYSYCATKVAHDANLLGWDSKNLSFFYRVVATSMHKHLGDVIQTAHRSSTEAARHYNLKGKIPLALQLIDPDLFTHKQKSPTKVVPPSTHLTQLKQALNQQIHFAIKQKANLALKAIKHEIPNTQHCIIFKYSFGKVSPLYQSGYSVDTIKSIQWNAPSSVFDKLKNKKSAVHLFGVKLKSLLSELPHQAGQIIEKNSHLFLASTLSTENEMMIFWLEAGSEFDENDFKKLKQIVSLTSHKTH
ncbi:HDOD domain-containing protein [Marinomonas sp. 2405UD66-6]|uniref:HDOD domain-containing protein n=1 Tax=Marinomonas sp. 2405UD66-6 TaxID=3391834 RepID=UPI0039C9D528